MFVYVIHQITLEDRENGKSFPLWTRDCIYDQYLFRWLFKCNYL